ncbi:MAG: V-type ATP synthase subunit D [Chlamydiae bacterium]|nr:V-type ATP synthase subunit D [Chlamydiota bacterium]
MAAVKLSKTELRSQQVKLSQLQTYLPTLQLKKALLQAEIAQAIAELEEQQAVFIGKERSLDQLALLFSESGVGRFVSSLSIDQVQVSYENIAGVDIPCLDKVTFKQPSYSLFDTPIWYEAAEEKMQEFLLAREKVKIARAKKEALEKELREVSIRVNLFEKIMIPRALDNIKKIKIFLGDQQLAAVSQAKVAKKKILEREERL